MQHGLLKPFEVQVVGGENDLSASFTITCELSPTVAPPPPFSSSLFSSHSTVAVTKTGATRLSLPPVWYNAEKVKSTVEITNEETKALLTKSLKAPKKKTDKKPNDAEK